MDIIFHAHHATISDHMRQRASAGARKLAARMDRPVDAIIRFEEDGRTRRVEIILHAPRHQRLVAEAQGRFFGPALGAALLKLRKQLDGAKRAVQTRRAAGA
jgi:ribosome-associated translation inhibitor RaiA